MNKCNRCGASITFGDQPVVRCIYCDADNPRPADDAPVDAAPATKANTFCPHCNVRLVIARSEHVALAGCPQCGGFWVDTDSATALMHSPQRVFIKLADQMSAKAKGKATKREDPKCPSCEGPMQQVDSHGITIDVCPAHGTWFDAHELQDMVKAWLAESAGKSDAASDAKVPCTACKKIIERADANNGAHGRLCDNCYRVERSRLAKAQSAGSGVNAGDAIEVAGGVVQVLLELLSIFG